MLELVKLGRIDKADEEGLPLLSLTVVDEFIHELPPPSPTICRELLKDRMPKEPQPEGKADSSDNPKNVPTRDTPHCEVAVEIDTTRKDKNETDDQPTPPRRCPRCLGTEFEFIECYWPDRASQRAQRCVRVRPP